MARVRTLSTRELNRALLARQGLLERKRVSVPKMIEKVGGLQSQEPRDPYVSLWSRIEGFDRAKLDRAADKREIVRGSWLRCTIHTVTADDFRRDRLALGPVIARDAANWRQEYVGLDIPKVRKAVEELLSDDVPRSAREIAKAIHPKFPKVSLEGLVNCARIHVPVVMTPGEAAWGYNRPPKLMLADRWVGELAPPDPTDLILRGIAAIGPVSTSDLRTWSGLPGVKDAIAPLLPDLKVFRDEAGRELYDLPGAPRPKADTQVPVRFLGEFDNFLLSHADRSRVIDAEFTRRFNVSTNGRRLHTFLVDGFVAGAWKPELTKKQIKLTITPFIKLSSSDKRAANDEALQLAEMLGPGLDPSIGFAS